MSEQVPRWQRLVAAIYVVVLVVAVALWHGRLHADFIPLDSSRVGPNIVAAVVTILAMTPLAVLVWPPTRRRIHRFVDAKLAPSHEHNEWVARHIAEMYERHMGVPASPHPYLDLSHRREEHDAEDPDPDHV